MTRHWSEQYIGAPWRYGAAGPDAFDCWGLVRAIYAGQFGITVDAVDIDAYRPLAVRHAFERSDERSKWREIHLGKALEGDVVLLSHGYHPHHVGLWLDGGGVLHAVEGAGVVFQSRQSLTLHGWNLLNAYRRMGAQCKPS